MNYSQFLEQKTKINISTGIVCDVDINPILFNFQNDIVCWAIKRGSAAIWADCGLGKSFMQLEWAKHIPGNILILAPLSVAQQTVREGEKIGVNLSYCRSQEQIRDRITITNYEMLDKFDAQYFNAIILDESSILKSLDGKTRTRLIEIFSNTKFKLACTATPSPNDFMELGNHAEFLGVMTRSEMLSTYFVHDGGETSMWRLKGHAEKEFWRWVCSWAVMMRKPSDLGYSDDGFVLPPINYKHITVESKKNGRYLFPMHAVTLQERLAAKRDSVNERIVKAVEILNNSNEQWIVWCNLNSEQDALSRMLNKKDYVSIKGSDSIEDKTEREQLWRDGHCKVLISKSTIFGFGLNWQHCRNVIFLSLSDSFEQYYQAIRRCWRFGQKNQVNCYIITSTQECAVIGNIKRKESDADKMFNEMVKNMSIYNKENLKGLCMEKSEYKTGMTTGEHFKLCLGDCVDVVKGLESDSIHYSVFSPPFASLYTYSASERDMGNSKNYVQFFDHFRFLVNELYRVIIPGRLLSFHCMNLPILKQRHGYIGIQDFRGDLIRLFESAGFIFHSEVVIWKDPVTAMQRTKALGLLHKQLKKDSCMSRQGIPDYLVTMRKPGDNPEPVSHTNDNFPVSVWQNYASPVWMDINPSDTLQYQSAREHQDEKHICPLQLDVIRRALRMWSNQGDTILSPFAGIGSEGYVAIEMGRRFIGVELKESYWKQAKENLCKIETKMRTKTLFNDI